MCKFDSDFEWVIKPQEGPNLVSKDGLVGDGFVELPKKGRIGLGEFFALADVDTAPASPPTTAGMAGQYWWAHKIKLSNCLVLQVADSGISNLFFCVHESVIRFSDSLTALRDACVEVHEINRGLEKIILQKGWVPKPQTMYQGIFEVPADSLTSIDQGHISYERKAPERQVSSSDSIAMSSLSDEKQVDALYEAFMESLKSQVNDADDVAVLLGGFDSGLTASGLARLGKKVTTFTYRFADSRYNQQNIHLLQSHIGNRHIWVDCDEDVYMDGIKNYARYFGQPTNWSSYVIFSLEAARTISSMGYDHVHTGDGADVLFWGYPLAFERGRKIEALSEYPEFVLRLALFCLNTPLLERLAGRPWHVLVSAIDQALSPTDSRGIIPMDIVNSRAFKWLFEAEPRSDFEASHYIDELARKLNGASFAKKAFASKALISPSKIKLNSFRSVAGVGMSSPYFSPILKTAVQELPEDLLRKPGDKATNDMGKYMLAKMAESRQMLPSKFIYQEKFAASDTPAQRFLSDEEVWGAAVSNIRSLPFKPKNWVLERARERTLGERFFELLFGAKTSGVISTDHLGGLLISLGAFYESGYTEQYPS